MCRAGLLVMNAFSTLSVMRHQLCAHPPAHLNPPWDHPRNVGGSALLGRQLQPIDFMEHGFPRWSGMDQHGEHLPHDSAFVYQVGRGSIVAFGDSAVEIGYDWEARFGFDPIRKQTVLLQIRFLLRHGDHRDAALLERIVHVLQLNQLRQAKRSPEGTVGRNDDVRLTEIIVERDSGAIGSRQREPIRFVTDV